VIRIRIAVLVIVVSIAASWTVPAAFAQEDAPPGEAPAIVVEAETEEAGESDQAWTFRFLVPTVLAMAGLAVAATIMLYGVRVRGRYRVVR